MTIEQNPLLRLVLAHSALELVPRTCWNHPSVRAEAKRRGKPPGHLLLDASLHQEAMRGLEEADRRGRPDLVHSFLLNALGTPLNAAGLLEVVVHARGDYLLRVDPSTRLPRSQARFKGLVEKLASSGERGKSRFLSWERGSLRQLFESWNVTRPVVTSRAGEAWPAFWEFARRTWGFGTAGRGDDQVPVVLVGGFQFGSLRENYELPSGWNYRFFSLSQHPLDAWTVAARVIFLVELARLGLQ
ncbi:MAG: 16S rRNA methyltransferase [Promethearchaeota archaeon]